MFWLYYVIGIPVVLLAALVLYYQHTFQYWKKKNVFHLKPSFPFGNLSGAAVSKSVGDVFKANYELSKTQPYVGIWAFFKPALVVQDPELIKHLFIKDFNHFQDRGIYYDKEGDPLAGM
jgi:cytochrome P450 family 6